MVEKAVLAALVAFAVAAALTPLVMRFARRIGAVDELKEIGLAKDRTPLLGGLAIFGGALVAGLIFLPDNQRTEGILAAAALITIVGALDDIYDLHPAVKLIGQIAAGVVLVTSGVQVDAFTFPFLHRVELGDFGGPLTVFALVVLMNIVNFSDGVDGLAAGVARSPRSPSRSSPSTSGATPRACWPRSHAAPRSASCCSTSTRPRSSWATAVRTCSGCCWAR